jgi:hypothetical protein
VDRVLRRPLMVGADLGRAGLLALIPLGSRWAFLTCRCWRWWRSGLVP